MSMRTCSSSSRASSSSARSGSNGRSARMARRLGAALLVAAVGLVGCGKAKSGKHLIGFSQCNLGEPWRVSMNADVAAAAKGFPDIEVAYADAQQDNAKQVADVEN